MSHIERIPVPGTPSHPQVRRKMPDPFQRPVIDLDGGRAVKRSWRTVLACDLKAGDTVPGIGLITSVVESVVKTGERYEWPVTVEGGVGIRRVFKGSDQVLAFVPERS